MYEKKIHPTKIKILLKAIRYPFFIVTIIPISLGTVIAFHETNHFNFPKFLLTLIGGIFVHMGLNLCNDYFDHLSRNDDLNPNPTPFSGGSRVIQEGLLSDRFVLLLSILSFTIGALVGLYLNHITYGNIILIFGIIGFIFAIFYTSPPFKFGYHKVGELIVGLGFGPLLVFGSYYVQKQNFSISPLFASLPMGILATSVLYINEFPDYEADKLVNKNTLIVTLGKKRAASVFPFILMSSYIITLVGIFLKILPLSTISTFVTSPLAFKVVKSLKKNCEKIYELLPTNARMIKLYMIFGLLLIISYLFDRVI